MNNLKIYSFHNRVKQDKSITFAHINISYSTTNNKVLMETKKNRFNNIFFLVVLIALFLTVGVSAQDARFTVVLDAGHGGHDPGAQSAYSQEKEINLAVTLNLGKLIERNFDDVKVVYTRKTDVYLTLQERADIVNNNHADIFICIHTNASKSASAFGAETFTLGLAKTKGNLDVAMRENSVILLEEDYKTKYKGFDPASVDSYIMFEFMQDKYIDKSVDFASTIQNQFVNYCRRSDRGVRQAGFWVLHRSACPSVLVELGFISNPAEERYLASKIGQQDMAIAIYNAFVNFKRDYEKKSSRQSTNKNIKPIERTDVASTITDKADSTITKKTESITTTAIEQKTDSTVKNPIIFKVQFLASKQKYNAYSPQLKGLKDVSSYTENEMYKYTVGTETEYSKILKIRAEVVSKFPEAFIIAYDGKKKITAKEALKLIK